MTATSTETRIVGYEFSIRFVGGRTIWTQLRGSGGTMGDGMLHATWRPSVKTQLMRRARQEGRNYGLRTAAYEGLDAAEVLDVRPIRQVVCPA